MNKILFLSLFFSLSTQAWGNWGNPQVACPEEVLPKGISCLDLTQVENPLIDFPNTSSTDERSNWNRAYASDLKLCRHREVLRREALRPGSFSPLQKQIAWMTVNGGEKVSEKLSALMSASRKHQIPPQVLLGAITQESLLSSLGISPDGGNYSCGIAQLNISEWCQSINTLPAAEREAMGWPRIFCDANSITPAMVRPFYDIAALKLKGRPAYLIDAKDFEGITESMVVNHFPAASEATQKLRFQAVSSFIKNCQNISLSISAKGHNLKHLFANFVPAAIRSQEIYRNGETFPRKCAEAYPSPYYPLHTGWLLAVAMYNAGPREARLVEHYFKVPYSNVYPQISPLLLIEALHWGGQFKHGTKKVYFTGNDRKINSQLWYKSCVVQRHIARVIQHVTIPGKTIAKSLEQVPCSNDQVPAYRQVSSGVKEN